MYPILLLSFSGLLTLFLGFYQDGKWVKNFTMLFLVAAIGAAFVDFNKPGVYFFNMLSVNNFNILISVVLLFTALLIVGLSDNFKEIEFAQSPEYYAIMQFSLVGAIMMTNFQSLLMLFLGIEILSVSMYVLTGADKRNLRGNEAAIKYFLMGAFATGIILFGMAMIYGGVGAFEVDAIAGKLAQPQPHSLFIYIGLIMLLIGLLFKLAAAPFHFWTPDVYQGAPTIFTLFMSTIVKTAVVFALYKVLHESFQNLNSGWALLLIGIIALSMIIGNISAATQTDYKRMLAYSSISHAGFLLMALVNISETADKSLLFYSASYALANIGAFGVLLSLKNQKTENGRADESIHVFNGLATKSPFLSGILIISMLSLAGIPLTSGFWSKFFVLKEAATSGQHFWLIILALVLTTVGIYYYFKPIMAVFKKSGNEEVIEIKPIIKFIFVLTALATIVLGVFPDLLFSLI